MKVCLIEVCTLTIWTFDPDSRQSSVLLTSMECTSRGLLKGGKSRALFCPYVNVCHRHRNKKRKTSGKNKLDSKKEIGNMLIKVKPDFEMKKMN